MGPTEKDIISIHRNIFLKNMYGVSFFVNLAKFRLKQKCQENTSILQKNIENYNNVGTCLYIFSS